MFVEHETPFTRQDLPTFDLTCELFTYSDEKIDTGVEELMSLNRNNLLFAHLNLSPFLEHLQKVKLSQVEHHPKQQKLQGGIRPQVTSTLSTLLVIFRLVR